MNGTSAGTRHCYVIGDPVEHSLSPKMHNAGYKALGIESEFHFVASRVKAAELKAAISGFRAQNVKGISVTIPHKSAVMSLLDSVDEIANKIGAVNTIVNEAGKFTGYNTDWLGIVIPIERVAPISGKRAAILGAGGAARAAVFGMMQKGAKVKIFNRTLERGRRLSAEFGCEAGSLSNTKEICCCDFIINATSLGMSEHNDECPVDAGVFRAGQLAFDTVYRAGETQFIIRAKRAGAVVLDGLDMLLFQGLQQFDLYTGRRAPEEAMRRALREQAVA